MVHEELRNKLKDLTGQDVYPRFLQQRATANRRGIPFEMTFQQWAQAWDGKIADRGSRRGQLVMCRKDDVGPYAADNISIRTTQSNIEEHYRLRARKDVKAAWDFDGEDRSACVDWLENRRDVGYL